MISKYSKVDPKVWEVIAMYEFLMLLILVRSYHAAEPDPETGIKVGTLAMNINVN